MDRLESVGSVLLIEYQLITVAKGVHSILVRGQGKRMNLLNYILAVKIFEIQNPDEYLFFAILTSILYFASN